MTDSERDEAIKALQARVKELELDTLQQRTRRKLRSDLFRQHSMDASNPWSEMNQPHPIRWIKKWLSGGKIFKNPVLPEQKRH